MLTVEGLEKRLGLSFASSWSRVAAKVRRLSLVELHEGLGLGLVSHQKSNVSVSFRSLKLSVVYIPGSKILSTTENFSL